MRSPLQTRRHNRGKAFTLVELIVSVLIIMVLAAVGSVAYNQFVGKSSQAQSQASASALRNALQARAATEDVHVGELAADLWAGANPLAQLGVEFDGTIGYEPADGSLDALLRVTGPGEKHATCLFLPTDASVAPSVGPCEPSGDIDGGDGEPGDDEGGDFDASAPSEPEEPPVAQIRLGTLTAGASHTCAIDTSGAAWCWGSGILGDGNDTKTGVPAAEVSGGHTFVQLVSGRHICGLDTEGAAWCWGGNYYASLGDGTMTDRLQPVKVLGDHVFEQLTAGSEHTCGISSTGDTYCWGRGLEGQLGVGYNDRNNLDTRIYTPTKLNIRDGLTYLSAGNIHTCGLTPDEQVMCWGANGNWQVSGWRNGGFPYIAFPSAGPAGSFSQISAGGYHTCGIETSGATLCWGLNRYGQLGNGKTKNSSDGDLAYVTGGHTFTQVVLGEEHSCGLDDAGATWCWGTNRYGQLGDGSTTDQQVPVEVAGGHTFKQLAAGTNHTCGIDTAGDTWCWGYNGNWQLGDGSTVDRWVPTAVTAAWLP